MGNIMPTQTRPLASAIEAIGDTPLVALSRLTAGIPGRIPAKLDYLNPGFSNKDRIARQIVETRAVTYQLTKLMSTLDKIANGA
jgi:cysteine synthase